MRHLLEGVLFNSLKDVEIVNVLIRTVPLGVVNPWIKTKPPPKL